MNKEFSEQEQLYINSIIKSPEYSLVVDQNNEYNFTEEEKKFILIYIDNEDLKETGKILRLDDKKLNQYYFDLRIQNEIERIKLAKYHRMFAEQMLNIDQLGGYLTSLIVDKGIKKENRLSNKEKLQATKLLMELMELKKTQYDSTEIIDVENVENNLKELSAKTIKQLISSYNTPSVKVVSEGNDETPGVKEEDKESIPKDELEEKIKSSSLADVINMLKDMNNENK